MKVIHKSSQSISQKEVILQECSWGGFTQVLLSTIPLESNMTDFWDNTLKNHHQIDELVSNEYTLKNFPLSYEELVWLGKLQYDCPTKPDVKFSIAMMKEYGIFITIGNNQVVELRLLDYRYL